MSRQRGEMERMPLWMPVFMVTAALALAAVLGSMLRHSEVSGETAADRAFRSALLPDDWQTFSADVWSIGHPGDWDVTSLSTDETSPDYLVSTVLFAPEDVRGAMKDRYFVIAKIDGLTLEEIDAQLPEGYATETSEFLFAGYPAVKYVLADGSVVHYVEYATTVYAITTEHYDEAEVGIMLATFQFNVKE